jgi:hypothetical protein
MAAQAKRSDRTALAGPGKRASRTEETVDS